MEILVLDVETSGLSPETDNVVEVAAVRWSPQYGVIQCVSTPKPVIENPAASVNGISPEMTQRINQDDLDCALDMIDQMASRCDWVTSYNEDFDRPWFEQGKVGTLFKGRWFDAMELKYPRAGQKRDLVNMCVAHEIGVVSAHRALDDCLMLCRLMGCVEDLETQVERAARPRVLVKACIRFEENDLARDAGFRFNQLVPKAWARKMPLEDAEELPFRWTLVQPG